MSVSNTVVTKIALPLLGGKRLLSDAMRTRARIAENAQRPQSFTPPRRLHGSATVRLDHDNGWPVYDLAPTSTATGTHVLYLHGGAYISEIVRAHWSFLGHLVKARSARCIVPIYPLGTAADAAEVVSHTADIAARLIEQAGSQNVVLMGDSAGGGMALAVAQTLRDRHLRPRHVVLISPWLDVAVDDPEQAAIAERDAMLGIPGLQEAGRTYAAGLAIDDPRVSPIYGDFSGLAPVTAFTGTEDLLNPDSHALAQACSRVGGACELIEAQGLPHVYPLMPTREGRAARAQIAAMV